MTDENLISAEIQAKVPPPHDVPVLTPQKDLEVERDTRVIPVAQGVLQDIAGQDKVIDIADKSEFTNVIIKILNRTLAADLNLTTDNPYVFQLVLGTFAAFNQVVMASKMAPSEDVRYSSIAHEMMLLLAGANVPMGMNVKTEEQVTALEAIRPQLEAIFEREMLTNLEVTYILEGLMNALKVTEQVFSSNVQQAVDRMESKILQLDDMSDLTMKKLDDTLKTDINEILKVSQETGV